MNKLEINISDYYDDSSLNEMIKFEIREKIKNRINNESCKKIDDISYFEFKKTFEELLQTEFREELKSKISNAIKNQIGVVDKYTVLWSEYFKEIVKECIEENKILIKEQILKELKSSVDKNTLINEFSVEDTIIDIFKKGIEKS